MEVLVGFGRGVSDGAWVMIRVAVGWGVLLGGTPVAVAVGSVSAVGSPAAGVIVCSAACTVGDPPSPAFVALGVQTTTVESSGGSVGIAPQELNSNAPIMIRIKIYLVFIYTLSLDLCWIHTIYCLILCKFLASFSRNRTLLCLKD